MLDTLASNESIMTDTTDLLRALYRSPGAAARRVREIEADAVAILTGAAMPAKLASARRIAAKYGAKLNVQPATRKRRRRVWITWGAARRVRIV